jgi:hypothetical protein
LKIIIGNFLSKVERNKIDTLRDLRKEGRDASPATANVRIRGKY